MDWLALIGAVGTILTLLVQFIRRKQTERDHDSTALVTRDRDVLRDGLERLREK